MQTWPKLCSNWLGKRIVLTFFMMYCPVLSCFVVDTVVMVTSYSEGEARITSMMCLRHQNARSRLRLRGAAVKLCRVIRGENDRASGQKTSLVIALLPWELYKGVGWGGGGDGKRRIRGKDVKGTTLRCAPSRFCPDSE